MQRKLCAICAHMSRTQTNKSGCVGFLGFYPHSAAIRSVKWSGLMANPAASWILFDTADNNYDKAFVLASTICFEFSVCLLTF